MVLAVYRQWEPRKHLIGHEGVKQPRGRKVTRKAPSSEWSQRSKAAWSVPLSQERASPSGQGALQRVWRLDTRGYCCVESSVSGCHSLTNQASFVVKRAQRSFRCSTGRFRDALLCNLSGAFQGSLRHQRMIPWPDGINRSPLARLLEK